MKPKSFATGNNEVVEALKDWAVDVYYPTSSTEEARPLELGFGDFAAKAPRQIYKAHRTVRTSMVSP